MLNKLYEKLENYKDAFVFYYPIQIIKVFEHTDKKISSQKRETNDIN